jgi:hypothetical protein
MRLAKTRLPAAGQWPSAVLTGISDQQQLDQIVVLSIQPASSRRWHAGRPRSRTAAPGRDHEKDARAKVAGKFDVVLKEAHFTLVQVIRKKALSLSLGVDC